MANASRSQFGPDLEAALAATGELEVPQFWVEAVLAGWTRWAEVYGRPLAKELVVSKPVRFLRVGLLPDLRFEGATRPCRLCGFDCQPPRQCWHAECFDAFFPHSAKGWRKLAKEVVKRAGGRCELCGAGFVALKLAKTGKPGRRVYDIDHITPLFKGGAHSLENLQALCNACHRKKTGVDFAKPKPERPDQGLLIEKEKVENENPDLHTLRPAPLG